MSVSLPKCPTWIDPNVGGYGYYRYSLDEKRWASFAGVIEKQDDNARVAFLNNLWAQVESGSLAPDVLLKVLPAFDSDTSRVVVDTEIDVLGEFNRKIVSSAATAAFAKYVTARLTPHMKALPVAKPGGAAPSEDVVLERRSLFRALGEIANDPATLAEANKLALAWLADPTSVDGDMARVAVTLGSRRVGTERIDALRAAMKSAKNPNDQKTALLALSDFDDAVILDKALDVALTDEVRTQDVALLLLNAVWHPSTERAATDWIVNHWDAIRAKLPGFLAGRIFWLAGRACTKQEIDETTTFFTAKSADVEGSARPLAEGLEAAGLCRALSEKDGDAVDRFFKVGAAPAVQATVVAPKPAMKPAPKPKK
jgi:hypothetical protein